MASLGTGLRGLGLVHMKRVAHQTPALATFGLLAASALLATAGLARAGSTPQVDVQLGSAVQARADELGRSELDGQRRELQQQVERAVARSPQHPSQVRLVIQDIQPNRPTSGQLGLSAGLSSASLGLGGAAVTGEVVLADGTRLPVRYRFFQDELRNETNFTTWGDADDAFDTVAHDIAVGRPPNDTGSWPPPRPPRAPTGTRLLN